jgi:hypothetical protein
LAHKIEQIRPAVVHLAIHHNLEASPHHRQIVIDAHQRILYALLDVGGSGLPTRSAKASNVIWVGLTSRISTIVPPGSSGCLMASASRFAMPSNITFSGARTACSSEVAACSDAVRKPLAVTRATNKTQRRPRKIFMDHDSNLREKS